MDETLTKAEIEAKRAKIEAKGGIVCDKFDECHNQATRNLQECWVEWKVKKNGGYNLKPMDIEETGGDNYHLCDDCEY